MIRIKVSNRPLTHGPKSNRKSKVEMDSDIVSVGFSISRKDFYKGKPWRFALYYAYAFLVMVV